MGSILAANDSATIDLVADAFRRGHILLYPTTTVYGLGGDPIDRTVSERIRAIKGSHFETPHLLLTDEWERAGRWLSATSHLHRRLMEAANDLVITILFDAAKGAPPHLVGESGRIAIRRTRHDFCRDLISTVDSMLVSTSANRVGKHPPAIFDDIDPHVLEQTDIAVVGPAGSGLSSTIVAVENDAVVVLRIGGTSRESLNARLELTEV